MKKKRYGCDGGSICIGTPEARACFPNNFGDGGHWVFLCEQDGLCALSANWDFKGAVEGTDICVFDYDCLTDEECKDDKHILFRLSGRFGVFANNGNIGLERWG